jgi:hypothetical protein
MVRRILPNRFEVDVFEHYQLAESRLAAGIDYEAVLCGLVEPGSAIKIFEEATARSADTRLIPIASDLTQLFSFREQWTSDARRKQKCGSIGQEWLSEHFTVGDIHALFPPRAQAPAPDSADQQAMSNKASPPELDPTADQSSAAEEALIQGLNGMVAGSSAILASSAS